MSHAIEEYMKEGKPKKGFLIFIDDLDRIEPITAVNILELLKNIFDIPNCLFILAIDYDVIVKGLKPKFGELTPKNEREFRSFFDKIIQLPFSMPVASYKVDGFLMKSLEKIGYFEEKTLQDKDVAQMLSRISSLSVGRNPRAMKRLTNILSLIKIFNSINPNINKKNDERHERIINFALICLQLAYPRVYDLLADEPDFINEWDSDKALQMGLIQGSNKNPTDQKEEQQGDAESNQFESEEEWVEFLRLFCNQDIYLKLNHDNIVSILKEVIELCAKDSKESIPEILQKLLALSSVTQVTVKDSSSSPKPKNKKQYVETLNDWIEQTKRDGFTDAKIELMLKFHGLVDDIGRKKETTIIYRYTSMINFYVEGKRKAFALSYPSKSGNLNIQLHIGADEAKKYLPSDLIKGTVTKGRYKIIITSLDHWNQLQPQLEQALTALIEE
jgi:hypothetical protein